MSPTGPPTFIAKDGAAADTGVISPGHTFRVEVRPAEGQVLRGLCFWPSKVDGTPHAIMGMFDAVPPELTPRHDALPPLALAEPGTGGSWSGLGALAGELPGLPLGHGVLVGARVVAPRSRAATWR